MAVQDLKNVDVNRMYMRLGFLEILIIVSFGVLVFGKTDKVIRGMRKFISFFRNIGTQK